jgi:aspartate carbamoyltransferase catalytic subunit
MNHLSELQVDDQGRLKHLLALQDLSEDHLITILQLATHFLEQQQQSNSSLLLANKKVINLFFEQSTRTRTSFELAAKQLGAHVVNFNVGFSSAKKGETLIDMAHTLESMQPDLLIVRHPSGGAAEFLAKHICGNTAIINAGDGCHEHPSQGLLDLFTICQHKSNLEELCVVIVGDILHSRVARSQIYAFTTMGISDIRVVAPKTLTPALVEKLGVRVFDDLNFGIKNVDVILALRLQSERMQGIYIPSKEEYHRLYGITVEKLALAKPDAIVMHPGPLNREVEIASAVADGPQSLILQQVTYGIAVRMAIMALLLNPEGVL